MEDIQVHNYFVMVEFYYHNMLMMQVQVEASGGQMPMDITQYLAYALRGQDGLDTMIECVHNYHQKWEEQNCQVTDRGEKGTIGNMKDDTNVDKGAEVEMDSEVEVVEKSRVEGPQDSDELQVVLPQSLCFHLYVFIALNNMDLRLQWSKFDLRVR